MSIEVLYRTSALAIGGRAGSVSSDDGQFHAALALPKALGGSGAAGVNPEILFAAGYAACFGSALQFVAEQKGVKTLRDVEVRARVGLGPRSEGGFGLAVALEIGVAGVSLETAQSLVKEAHEGCPYSNATRGNIDVELSVHVA